MAQRVPTARPADQRRDRPGHERYDRHHQAKKGDGFVDYFSAGTSLLVERGNPHAISDLLSLCGQKVAAEAGTTQQDLLKRSQSQCPGNPIDVMLKPTNDDAILQLRTGQVAALLMDFPTARVLTTDPRTYGLYQLASDVQYEPGLYGIGIAKSNPGPPRPGTPVPLGNAGWGGAAQPVLSRPAAGRAGRLTSGAPCPAGPNAVDAPAPHNHHGELGTVTLSVRAS